MSPWRLRAQRRGFRPLAMDGDVLLGHARGALWRTSADLSDFTRIADLPAAGFAHRLGTRVRLVDRVLRSSPSHALLEGDALFVCRRSQIWRVDLATGKVTLDFTVPGSVRALQFAVLTGADGRRELVFGEYFDNPSRAPVRVWGRRVPDGEWRIRYQFPAGEIEHIHSVTQVDGRVWILCGDFEHSAGFWRTDADFSTVAPVLRGRQEYRAAWLERVGGRSIYATDTQLEPNHLYQLDDNGTAVQPRRLAPLQGSSIYCGRAADRVFFSTSVESGAPSGSLVRDLLDTRRGAGILSDQATLLTVGEDGEVEQIHAARKDALPFRLAQFGTYTFPSGTMPPDTAVAYGIALRGFDDTWLVFSR